ncbi:hypothetical protein LUZ60_013779 [Juncus effusus]|nr:hypothetical protein LUZ60_013779 [Juncus effusus]
MEITSQENIKGVPSEEKDEVLKKEIQTTFSIFRAAPSVRHTANELYRPWMVTIGPYHRDKKEVVDDMTEHKNQFLTDFKQRSPAVRKEVYEKKIKNLLDIVQEFYSEKVKLENDVLLLDSCFILEFLLKLYDESQVKPEDKDHGTLLRIGWDPVTILSDLLLLENQIPFPILEKLYEIVKENNLEYPDLRKLIIDNLFLEYLNDGIVIGRDNKDDLNNLPKETHHLLHLYHQASKPSRETNTLNSKPPSTKKYNVPQVIPCATQLIEFGVKLRRNIKPKPHDIFHVYFKKNYYSMRSPHLFIPQLVLDPTRRTLLMNLLAFEKCVPKPKRRWTGLLILLNSIMKSKNDLDILQRSGIVLNLFPSEDEAIKFVGQLSEQVTVDFSNHYFSDMFRHINKHCEKRSVQLRATFMHQYFSNPWAVFTFTLSLLAFFLSSVQTFISASTYRNRFNH